MKTDGSPLVCSPTTHSSVLWKRIWLFPPDRLVRVCCLAPMLAMMSGGQLGGRGAPLATGQRDGGPGCGQRGRPGCGAEPFGSPPGQLSLLFLWVVVVSMSLR